MIGCQQRVLRVRLHLHVAKKRGGDNGAHQSGTAIHTNFLLLSFIRDAEDH
jgi:hypothetical protein